MSSVLPSAEQGKQVPCFVDHAVVVALDRAQLAEPAWSVPNLAQHAHIFKSQFAMRVLLKSRLSSSDISHPRVFLQRVNQNLRTLVESQRVEGLVDSFLGLLGQVRCLVVADERARAVNVLLDSLQHLE